MMTSLLKLWIQFYLFAHLNARKLRFDLLLLGPFKNFHFKSPNSQSSKTGSSWLIKDYTAEDFCKDI